MSLFTDPEDRMPVWLDCDPGHDDAFAILLSATHPFFNLLGISTIHGNASLDKVTYNALSILTAIGKPDIPVHPGSRKPFMRPAIHAPDIHGSTGIDGTDLMPTPTAAAQKMGAVEAMRNAIMSTPPNTCGLVVTGTMTNAALLFATFPETAAHIKCLSIMGGGFDVGNITKFAEFNIYCDPEAASSIFSLPALSGKTYLVPLDLTHTVLATSTVREALMGTGTNPTPFRTMLHDLLMYFADTYARVFDMTTGPPLHDPLAMAALMVPDRLGFEWEEGFVEVVLQGEELGRTVFKRLDESVNMNSHSGAKMLEHSSDTAEAGVVVKVGRKVDADAFWNVIMAVVDRADEVSPLNH
ncbi:hypothetical protein ABW19_dt0206868 [Dactylella cylindrospora]|nr:hypothetical protein ABW19_dt0206868 [Dactylella cylindrospora]